MPPYCHSMPIDKSVIKTRLRIHPALFDDHQAFVRNLNPEIRTIKLTRGSRSTLPTSYLTFDILAYKGIKVRLDRVGSDPLVSATIDFNPGVCLYGHNGRTLCLAEFLDALHLLVFHLSPLVSDPADLVDVVPGLRPGSPAYWSYLEVLLQCPDPDGKLLAQFRYLRHPDFRSPTRHWADSLQAGGSRGELQLSIYRKAEEMMQHDKLSKSERANVAGHLLRLEMRVREPKLVQYFGSERNTESIDGKQRLVRFYPADLIQRHRACFGELQGVFLPNEDAEGVSENSKPLSALGRLLAQVAYDPRTKHSFQELLTLLGSYTGAKPDSNTISRIRKAGLAELSRLSPLTRTHIFSNAAYEAMDGIASESREKLVRHMFDEMVPPSLISNAYRPPGHMVAHSLGVPSYLY